MVRRPLAASLTCHLMTESRTSPTLCVFVIGNGAFREARFLDPGGAGHLAVAVLRVVSGEHGRGIGGASRQNGGDSGADRSGALLQFAFSGNQGGVAHSDARNVGNCVERAGISVKRNMQIPRAMGRLGAEIHGSR